MVENSVLLLLLGSKMQIKLSFMVLEMLLFGFGTVLEIVLKEFVEI